MIKVRPITVATLLPLVLLVACTDDNRNLTLAVSTEDPARPIAEAIRARLVADDLLIDVSVSPDPTDIFQLIHSRSVDLGVVEEPDRPVSGLVTVAPLYPSVLHVLHNKDVLPSDFAELLRGSDVYAGPAGGAAQRLLVQLAADFGVQEDQYQVLDNPWTIVPNVYFVFGGLLSSDAIRQLSGYRFFSFSKSNDIAGGSVVDAIVLKYHQLKPFLLPRNTYFGLQREPVTTVSIRTVLIAHEDFSSDLVLEISSHLFNNAQEFSLDYPLVTRELNTNVNSAELMFPLHTGTRRFLDRDKPGLVERYVDVIALVLSILLAVASGLFAFFRHRQQVKKDRVDTFYTKLLALRDQAEQTTEHKELKSFRIKAIGVQQEVLQLLVDERISADSSLIAFLSLSNQVINELNHRIGYDI